MNGPRLNPAQRDQILALYAAGQPIKKIAHEFGVTKQNVSSLANRRNMRRHGKARPKQQEVE